MPAGKERVCRYDRLDALRDFIFRFDIFSSGREEVADSDGGVSRDISKSAGIASVSPTLAERALFRVTTSLVSPGELAYTSRSVSFIERNMEPVDWALEKEEGVVR